MRRGLRHTLLLLAVLLPVLRAPAGDPPTPLTRGKGQFLFQAASVNGGAPLRVWYFLPDSTEPLSPVLIVMHGVNRDAERYLDQWTGVARRRNAVLLCPEFSLTGFPGDANYNLGNVYAVLTDDEQVADPQPEDRWSLSILDPLFDSVAASLRLKTTGYALYGHSAGSQFVHRLIFFKPSAKITRAVSANAGWYLMPDFDLAFPFGLRNTPCDSSMVRAALGRPLTVLLGEADNDPNHKHLRRTPTAMLQGANRFDRGLTFFKAAQELAARWGAPFRWSLATVPGVGHSDRLMSVHAEKILFRQ